jgi:hypothetical protein
MPAGLTRCRHCGGWGGIHTGECLNPALHPGTFYPAEEGGLRTMAVPICPECGERYGLHAETCSIRALYPDCLPTGWVCPKCKRANAPSVRECACYWESGESDKMVEERGEEF